MALLAGVTAACGTGQWREADARMNETAQAARAAGFRPMAGAHNTFGVFTAAGSTTWRVRLDAARQSFIAAGCTAGCTSLDMSVADSSGAPVASATSPAAAPALLLGARPSGLYLVTFRHGSCRMRECRWVAQVWEKR